MPKRSFSLLRRALPAFALVTFAACEDSGTTGPSPVAEVRVTAAAPSILVGQTMTLVATPLSARDRELTGRPIIWTSDNVLRATVSAAGLVTALSEGVVTITATSEGVQGNAVLAVGPVPADEITFDVGPLDLLEGTGALVRATVRDSLGRALEGRTIVWSSEDPATARVDADGAVTAVGEGVTRIAARHGDLEAFLAIEVRPDIADDLLYDKTDGVGGLSRLFLANPRATTTAAQPIFGSPGNWQASASPDGTRIVFACAEPHGPAICTAARNGSDLRVLTESDAASEDQPAWSPDGTRIAYRRWPHGATPGQANPPDIWVMDADGGNKVNLTADALAQHQPSWSPQPVGGADRIVFVQEGIVNGYVVSNLHTIAADGSARQELTALEERNDTEPAWSPDGRTIVFIRSGGEATSDLWTVGAVTRVERELLAFRLTDPQRHPAWTANGKYIAFTSNHEPSPDGNYRYQVYTVRADGTRMVRRTTDAGDKEHPTWIRRP